MTRVLHCIWRLGIGGAERQLAYLAQRQALSGIDVHVATAFPMPADQGLRNAGCSVHDLRARGKFDVFVFWRLLRLMRQIAPDVVQTWLTQMDLLGGLAAMMTRTPWVLAERSSAAAYPPGIINNLRKFIGRRASAIVANSEGGAGYWRSEGARCAIAIVPNAVPIEEIEAAARLSENDVPGDVPLIVYVGGLRAEKNIERLLHGAAIALQTTRFALALCGDGVLRARLEALASELGIASSTRFVGFTPNAWSWIKCADAVIAVSVFEGDPNVALEALAAGTPLIVSDIAAYRALLDESTAIFVDAHSPQSIADGIRAALDEREKNRMRAERAKSRVEGRSVAKTASMLASVYEAVSKAGAWRQA